MQDKPTIIERSNQETHLWLKEIADHMGEPGDQNLAYHALRTVIRVVRDALIPDEALDLSSQLPTFVRGVYFEGYRLANKPTPLRSREAFLEAVSSQAERETNYDADPEKAARAVFAVLGEKLSPGQAQQVKEMLHKEVQELWPELAGRSAWGAG